MQVNVHFYIDSPYTQETINFINTNFSIEKNIHIVTVRSRNPKFVKPNSYPNIKIVDIRNFKQAMTIKRMISKINGYKTFYHYLSNDCIHLTQLIGISKKERNWILWG